MEHAICYVSTASTDFKSSEIENILNGWREKNSDQNIKGILLYSEGHFFQVIEGEKQKILELFNTIKNDSRHHNVFQVVGDDLTRGSFDDYIVEHLHEPGFSRPELIANYCESVKGMDPGVQQKIKEILKSFINTWVL